MISAFSLCYVYPAHLVRFFHEERNVMKANTGQSAGYRPETHTILVNN